MEGRWSALRLSRVPAGAPPLFVKASFTPTGYTAYVTDLSHVWAEKLERRQIVLRALEDDTTIDPSESAKQLSHLLNIIQDALLSKKPGTRRELQANHSPSNDDDGLILALTAPLPKPLGALKWRVKLVRMDDEHVKTELLLPLLGAAAACKHQASNLIRQLHSKDHVISKLMDKLDESGIELSSVFPSVAGIRGITNENQRTIVAQRVRGFAPFEESSLHGSSNQVILREDNLAKVVEDIFSTDHTFGIGTFQPVSGAVGWWKALDDNADFRVCGTPFAKGHTHQNKQHKHAAKAAVGTESHAPPPGSSPAITDVEGDTTEDELVDFVPLEERSATGDTTESEDAEDMKGEEVSSSSALPPPGNAGVGVRKLGQIGGPISSRAAVRQSAQSSNNYGTPQPSAGRIGIIGGKPKDAPESSWMPSWPDEPPRNHERPFPSSSKLIGGSVEREQRPSGKEVIEPIKAPGETFEMSPTERANRNREELRRQLESKSQAPVKKKRRF
ncbi:XRCC4-like factor-domain-containing protein [Lineolata rhizophorae]|uniref:Non-homologous end-joining factor 1 n=1 Tax=Lineolata rhizophorae TaxID=578093 RepID=A0A6A6P382_9PEZI|nr:XRCC4-like factor-domain-containing protein [Lineolata rhizophorae]